jgi:hypothetical protein
MRLRVVSVLRLICKSYPVNMIEAAAASPSLASLTTASPGRSVRLCLPVGDHGGWVRGAGRSIAVCVWTNSLFNFKSMHICRRHVRQRL